MTAAARRSIATALLVLAALHAVIALPRSTLAAGDEIQIQLPILGGACAAASGGLPEYLGRFAGSMAVVHGLKAGLGGAAINRRPTGGRAGFPSGHTAAAVYGASALARQCAAAVPYLGPLVILAAGFVAGSRIEAGRHDLRQVVAAALIGLIADRSFRGAASRDALRQAWRLATRRRRALQWASLQAR